MLDVILKIVFKGGDFDIFKLDISADQIETTLTESKRKKYLIVHVVQDKVVKSKFSYHIYDSLAPKPLNGSHIIVTTDTKAEILSGFLKITNSKNFNSFSNLLYRSPEMIVRILCRIEFNYIFKPHIGSRIFRDHNKSVMVCGGLTYELVQRGVSEK